MKELLEKMEKSHGWILFTMIKDSKTAFKKLMALLNGKETTITYKTY